MDIQKFERGQTIKKSLEILEVIDAMMKDRTSSLVIVLNPVNDFADGSNCHVETLNRRVDMYLFRNLIQKFQTDLKNQIPELKKHLEQEFKEL